MSIPNQLSMPGKINYTPGDEADGIISYNLDVDPGGNMPISAEVFQKGIAAFISGNQVPANISYTFDKQLLLILLSFRECTGLSFYNFLKPDGTQSLAVVAVDSTGTPIGWDAAKGTFVGGGNGFVGADFAHTATLSAAKQFVSPDGVFDFAGFIASVK